MLHDTIRFIGTIVMPAPDFFIPPSDSDPLHHFSTRDRRSANNLSTSASRTTMNSFASSQYLQTPVANKTRSPRSKSPAEQQKCCSCHLPYAPNTNTATPTKPSSKSLSAKPSRLPEPSFYGHRNEPAHPSVSPMKYKSLAALKQPPNRTSRAQTHKADEAIVSEMGELAPRKRVLREETKAKRESKIKTAIHVWAEGRSYGYGTRTKRSAMSRKKTSKQSTTTNTSKSSVSPKRNSCKTHDRNSFLSLPSRGAKSDGGRRLKSRDGSIVSVNRFGWPLSRRNSTLSSKTRPPAKGPGNRNQKPKPPPLQAPMPRPRSSFEVDLSPIIEDVQSFPSMVDIDSAFEPLNLMNSRRVATIDEEREEDDSRNFDHVNLSGSFVLQSTSCCDMKNRQEDCPPLPALVLTFPTPEPPALPSFPPNNSDSRLGSASLTVPTFPRCTHCGFGFGLDFHDLEVPYASKPCRLCEPQWVACKMWYQPAGSDAGGGGAVPVGAADGQGEYGVDEHGQMHMSMRDKRNATTATTTPTPTVEEGYARFSNVIIKDKTTKRGSTSVIWKKVTRLFASGARRASVGVGAEVEVETKTKAEKRRRRRSFWWKVK
ncbi:hypothetical protein HMN09_00897100 [Mycena chlorophos]|uniref:Uncharacterized protein n=1 Tax=Mycena chlorophos TaxID=658473 RepID=A0A8H6W4J8_MYCCL|nr:hypothetical protein HMN09_00897100 [Mycena chlorophos]